MSIEKIKVLFKNIDTENSGYITKENLTSIFAGLDPKYGKDIDLEVIMSKCKQTGQGINYEEFLNVIFSDDPAAAPPAPKVSKWSKLAAVTKAVNAFMPELEEDEEDAVQEAAEAEKQASLAVVKKSAWGKARGVTMAFKLKALAEDDDDDDDEDAKGEADEAEVEAAALEDDAAEAEDAAEAVEVSLSALRFIGKLKAGAKSKSKEDIKAAAEAEKAKAEAELKAAEEEKKKADEEVTAAKSSISAWRKASSFAFMLSASPKATNEDKAEADKQVKELEKEKEEAEAKVKKASVIKSKWCIAKSKVTAVNMLASSGGDEKKTKKSLKSVMLASRAIVAFKSPLVEQRAKAEEKKDAAIGKMFAAKSSKKGWGKIKATSAFLMMKDPVAADPEKKVPAKDSVGEAKKASLATIMKAKSKFAALSKSKAENNEAKLKLKKAVSAISFMDALKSKPEFKAKSSKVSMLAVLDKEIEETEKETVSLKKTAKSMMVASRMLKKKKFAFSTLVAKAEEAEKRGVKVEDDEKKAACTKEIKALEEKVTPLKSGKEKLSSGMSKLAALRAFKSTVENDDEDDEGKVDPAVSMGALMKVALFKKKMAEKKVEKTEEPAKKAKDLKSLISKNKVKLMALSALTKEKKVVEEEDEEEEEEEANAKVELAATKLAGIFAKRQKKESARAKVQSALGAMSFVSALKKEVVEEDKEPAPKASAMLAVGFAAKLKVRAEKAKAKVAAEKMVAEKEVAAAEKKIEEIKTEKASIAKLRAVSFMLAKGKSIKDAPPKEEVDKQIAEKKAAVSAKAPGAKASLLSSKSKLNSAFGKLSAIRALTAGPSPAESKEKALEKLLAAKKDADPTPEEVEEEEKKLSLGGAMMVGLFCKKMAKAADDAEDEEEAAGEDDDDDEEDDDDDEDGGEDAFGKVDEDDEDAEEEELEAKCEELKEKASLWSLVSLAKKSPATSPEKAKAKMSLKTAAFAVSAFAPAKAKEEKAKTDLASIMAAKSVMGRWKKKATEEESKAIVQEAEEEVAAAEKEAADADEDIEESNDAAKSLAVSMGVLSAISKMKAGVSEAEKETAEKEVEEAEAKAAVAAVKKLKAVSTKDKLKSAKLKLKFATTLMSSVSKDDDDDEDGDEEEETKAALTTFSSMFSAKKTASKWASLI